MPQKRNSKKNLLLKQDIKKQPALGGVFGDVLYLLCILYIFRWCIRSWFGGWDKGHNGSIAAVEAERGVRKGDEVARGWPTSPFAVRKYLKCIFLGKFKKYFLAVLNWKKIRRANAILCEQKLRDGIQGMIKGLNLMYVFIFSLLSVEIKRLSSNLQEDWI